MERFLHSAYAVHLSVSQTAKVPFHSTPDIDLVLFTLGVVLIYFEVNRPGAILPGALGLTLALYAVAALSRLDLGVGGLVLILTAIALFLVELLRPAPIAAAIAATLALCLGFGRLVVGPGTLRIHALTAALCGVVLGVGTSGLARLARRARANKALD